MLWEAWRMKPNEGEETQREVSLILILCKTYNPSIYANFVVRSKRSLQEEDQHLVWISQVSRNTKTVHLFLLQKTKRGLCYI